MEGLSQVPQNEGQQDPQEAAAKQAQEEQMRRDLMATVLDTAARERCKLHLYKTAVKC